MIAGHFPVGEIAVKKSLVIIMVFFVLLMAMGFASREWRPDPTPYEPVESNVHDAHFRYYEGIRPFLVAGYGDVPALCNNERGDATGDSE